MARGRLETNESENRKSKTESGKAERVGNLKFSICDLESTIFQHSWNVESRRRDGEFQI
jgi:hypothetical protein